MSSSIPPPRREALKIILGAITAAAVAVGGAAGSMFTTWWGGIATRADVAKALSQCARTDQLDELAKKVGEPKTSESTDPLFTRLRALESETRIRLVERISTETRARVGFQVALEVGLDPRRRKAAENAAALARQRFDQYVLQGMAPSEAAAKVIDTSPTR